MEINTDELQQKLSLCSYKVNGDPYEQSYGHYLESFFPNCEKVWRKLVVPMTQRIELPDDKPEVIGFRQRIDPKIINLSNIHYSLSMNLFYSHIHLERKMESSVEDIFTHLGTSCDLAESFLENWYILLLQCQGKQSEQIQGLSEEEFITRAVDWYRQSYSTVYEYYYSKGKKYSIQVPTNHSIIEEYLAQDERKSKYFRQSLQRVRQYRNVVVHNIIVGKIILPDGKYYLPKAEKILDYKTWDKIRQVRSSMDTISRDFSEMWDVAFEEIKRLEEALNSVWEIFLKDFDLLFYDMSNRSLRSLYDISLSTIKANTFYILDESPDTEIGKGTLVIPSGVAHSDFNNNTTRY